jgi:hypothetical protein
MGDGRSGGWVLCDPSLNRYAGSSGDRGAPWPGLAQVCRIERRRTLWRRGRPAGETKVEVRHYITSVPPERAGAQELLRRIGGHWGIENQVHWTRDMDWDEDRSQVRTGAAPPSHGGLPQLSPVPATEAAMRQHCRRATD